MLHVPADLGQRILELARIAAAMHVDGCAGADDVLMSEAPGGAGVEHALKDGGARLLRHTPRIDFGDGAMIYGMYLSAQGVQTASHRQDVVSNNIANAETVGFKKDLALFQQRRTALQENGMAPARSNRLLEMLGGGVQINPTRVDNSQGEMEHTGSHLDVAIVGEGFLRVSDGGGETLLTRAGRMVVNGKGNLALANNENYEVLDPKGKAIKLAGKTTPEIGRDGTITQDKAVAGRIGLVAVPDKDKLTKIGGTMLAYPDVKDLKAAPAITSIRAEYVERANVDPTNELGQLMDAQRQLEANANMIRYQDQMLAKLCNEVGKIG